MQFGNRNDYQPGWEMITFIIGIGITAVGIILGVIILGPTIMSMFPLGVGS